MEQQPEERLDEDLEIDPDAAANVTGGFAGGARLEEAAHHFHPNRLEPNEINVRE
jgi:hypothetical protein